MTSKLSKAGLDPCSGHDGFGLAVWGLEFALSSIRSYSSDSSFSENENEDISLLGLERMQALSSLDSVVPRTKVWDCTSI